MKKIVFSICAGAAILFGAGCMKSSDNGFTQTCTYDSCAVKATAAEIQIIQQYLADSGLVATQHCSGLFYSIEAAGTGAAPTPCSYVTVRYKGKFTNGNIFDQSGADPFSSILGNLVRGWVNGLPYLKAGGKIQLYVPPSLGYGSTDRKDQAGNVVIPANSVLIFEVDLISVQ